MKLPPDKRLNNLLSGNESINHGICHDLFFWGITTLCNGNKKEIVRMFSMKIQLIKPLKILTIKPLIIKNSFFTWRDKLFRQ